VGGLGVRVLERGLSVGVRVPVGPVKDPVRETDVWVRLGGVRVKVAL